MKDLHNSIDVKRCISPVSVSDNTAQVGQIIDRKGYDSVTFLIATGSIADADATFTVLLEEGDAANLSDAAAVADAAPEVAFDNPWESTQPLRLVHLVEHTSGWPDIGTRVLAKDEL